MLAVHASPSKKGEKSDSPGSSQSSLSRAREKQQIFSPWTTFRDDRRSGGDESASGGAGSGTPAVAAPALLHMLSPASARMVGEFPDLTPGHEGVVPRQYLKGAIPPPQTSSSGGSGTARGRAMARRLQTQSAAADIGVVGGRSRRKRTRASSIDANGVMMIHRVPSGRHSRVSAPQMVIQGPRDGQTETSDFCGWQEPPSSKTIPSQLLTDERVRAAPCALLRAAAGAASAGTHPSARRAMNMHGNPYGAAAPSSAVGVAPFDRPSPTGSFSQPGTPGTPGSSMPIVVGQIQGTNAWAISKTWPMGATGYVGGAQLLGSPTRMLTASAPAGRASALLGSQRALPQSLLQQPLTAEPLKPAVVVHASGPMAQNPCNCKKSRCLKLYCDCFAANVLCSGCRCRDCVNIDPNDPARKKAIATVLARNPDAFKPKIKSVGHTTGCHCKKSRCVKKYCECYQGAVRCNATCKCSNCRNRGNPGDVDLPTGSGKKTKKRKTVDTVRFAPTRAPTHPPTYPPLQTSSSSRPLPLLSLSLSQRRKSAVMLSPLPMHRRSPGGAGGGLKKRMMPYSPEMDAEMAQMLSEMSRNNTSRASRLGRSAASLRQPMMRGAAMRAGFTANPPISPNPPNLSQTTLPSTSNELVSPTGVVSTLGVAAAVDALVKGVETPAGKGQGGVSPPSVTVDLTSVA